MYVINLERRKDRLDDFLKKYELFSPRNLPLKVIKAIDGINFEEELKNPLVSKFNTFISDKNEFENNSRIRATIISHILAWKQISESNDEYGFIFEDDVLFREDAYLRRNYSDFHKNLLDFIKTNKEPVIIYSGVGDILPIHIDIPSESLLRSVEKNHVMPGSIKNKYFGRIKFSSSYVFDWLGAFAYIMPKKTARYLFDNILTEGVIKEALDVFLKNTFNDKTRYATVPLLNYHQAFDPNTYDSDTWGITVTLPNIEISNVSIKIGFIIESSPNSDEKMYDNLERVLESIIENEGNLVKLKFIIKTKECLIDKLKEHFNNSNIEFLFFEQTKINEETSLGDSEIKNDSDINDLIKQCDDCQYVSLWTDYVVMDTENWSDKLLKYSKQIIDEDFNKIISYQLKHRNSWEFNSIILSRGFIDNICSINTINTFDYIKFISYLSKVNVITRDIIVRRIMYDTHDKQKYIDEFYYSKEVKKNIDLSIEKIVKNEGYKPCGILVNYPGNWDQEIIGENSLRMFNKNI